MEHNITITSLETIDLSAKQFIEQTKGHKLIAFYGSMGAGKTTFTTAICRVLGVSEDAVSSPTFSIVNEYLLSDGESMFHFDFYRITKESEALDIGLYDYLDSGCLCVMEWPENIEELLPEETLKVRITVQDNGERVVTWED